MTIDSGRIRWLGREGENYFRRACNNSGLTATRPEHDENGWDFLVELPQNRLPLLNMDAQPSPIKFFCQVKATDDFENLRKSITVSNFEHLARNPLPSFVLILDYAGTADPTAVYLCHFHRNRIGQTLKRIRELQAAGNTQLHRHHMTLEALPDELIDTTALTWLKREVLRHTGQDMGVYVQAKTEILKLVGFDDLKFAMSFSTYLKIDEVVDAFLGLRDLDVSDLVVSTNRFGIQLPEESSATGKITIDAQPTGDCYVIVSSKKAKIKSRFPVSVISPSIPGLDPSHFKLRILWTFTEFLIDASSVKVQMLFDVNKVAKLSELTASLEFICASMEEDAQISFFHKFGQFANMQINDRIKSDFAFKRILDDLRTLRAFLDLSGYREDASLKIQNVYDQIDDIKWMRTALKQTTTTLTASYEPPDKIVPSKKGGIFARPIGFDLDDKSYVAFCQWNAKINGSNGTLEVKIRTCEVWNYIFVAEQIDGLKSMHQGFKVHCEAECGGCLIFYNLNEDGIQKRLDEKFAVNSELHEMPAELTASSSSSNQSSADTPEGRSPPASA